MAEERQRTRSQHKKGRKSNPAQVIPEVITLPPEQLGKAKLTVRFLSLIAVVVALLIGVSLFFRVDTVRVSGAEKYSADDILEASGIAAGDKLITLNRAKAAGRIQLNCPYVSSVRIGIRLPGTVNIEIEETEIVYAVSDRAGDWWLLSSAGKVIEKPDVYPNCTKIYGVILENPQVGQMAAALQSGPSDSPDTATTGDDRLQAALMIARALEQNHIYGAMTSIQVSSLTSLELWYGKRYQVNLGNTDDLLRKCAFLAGLLANTDVFDSGKVDLSFTLKDQMVCTPFAE